MIFTWSEKKNLANQMKHGISFETATLVFEDPLFYSTIDDRFEYDEERWQTVGRAKESLLFVSHTIKESYAEEIIRIISAREASPAETRRYSIH